VKEFVEDCRREWKRLRVPKPVANEMAAELAADLEEAQAEGATPEEMLGSGAFDPRSFAAAWAAERGVIGRPLPRAHRPGRASRVPAAIATFAAVIAIVGAVLVTVDARSRPERLTLASRAELLPGGVWVSTPTASSVARRFAPSSLPGALSPDRREVTVSVGGTARVVALALPATEPLMAVDSDASGIDSGSVGAILLIVGLAGIVPATLFLFWHGPGGRTVDDL
jgi:hypothetical protein